METSKQLELIGQFVESAASNGMLDRLRPSFITIADKFLNSMGDVVLEPVNAVNMAQALINMTLFELKVMFDESVLDKDPTSVVYLALQADYESNKALVTDQYASVAKSLDETVSDPRVAAITMLGTYFSGTYGQREAGKIFDRALKAEPAPETIWDLVTQNCLPFMKQVYDLLKNIL